MKKEKNSSFVAIVNNLTPSQSARLEGEIIKAKNKIAPNARATLASTNKPGGLKTILEKGQKQLGGD